MDNMDLSYRLERVMEPRMGPWGAKDRGGSHRGSKQRGVGEATEGSRMGEQRLGLL